MMQAVQLPPLMTSTKGRPSLNLDAVRQFQLLSEMDKREVIKNVWLEAGYVLAERVKHLAKHGEKADISKINQLVIAAGIASDKGYKDPPPPPIAAGHNTLVINLFGSLSPERLMRVVGPTVEVQALNAIPLTITKGDQ